MTSEKQLSANRRNAKKSTGPRTEIGKQNSSSNSIKHGILCRDVVLPNEDVTEFEEFYHALREQFQPVGAIEQMHFEHIVAYTWRLRRVAKIESGLFMRQQIKDEIEITTDIIDSKDPDARTLRSGDSPRTVKTYTTIHGYEHVRAQQQKEEDATPPEVKAERERVIEEARQRRAQAWKQLREGSGLLCEAFMRDAGHQDVFTKLLRYESATVRNLTRALNQLERLQSERAGKAVPAPVMVDVNLSAE